MPAIDGPVLSTIPVDLVAHLRTINAEGLIRQSPHDRNQLIQSVQKDGIFYLDLSDDQDTQNCVNTINLLSRDLFALGPEEKRRYDVDQLGALKLNGYKPTGRNFGGIKGQPDCFESYAIAQTDILSPTSVHTPRPPIIDHHMPSLKQLNTKCLSLARSILNILSDDLLLPEHSTSTLEYLHGLSQSIPEGSSMNIVRLLKYPCSADVAFHIPQAPHTDIGSLTFLFADTPGLQILPPGSREWLYVQPRPGMILVHVGDVLNILSNSRYQNILHRVSSLPGQGMHERYSLAFLLRPTRSASMMPLKVSGELDREYTCEEWVAMKFGALRRTTFECQE